MFVSDHNYSHKPTASYQSARLSRRRLGGVHSYVKSLGGEPLCRAKTNVQSSQQPHGVTANPFGPIREFSRKSQSQIPDLSGKLWLQDCPPRDPCFLSALIGLSHSHVCRDHKYTHLKVPLPQTASFHPRNVTFRSGIALRHL